MRSYLFTSESVSEGHPDKVCDRISDMVVDSYLSSGDPQTRVACETLTTTNKVVLAGEVRGPSISKEQIISQVREVEFPDGKKILLLSEGRLVNLGNATGHPSFVMSASFSNQVIAQIELWNNYKNYENKVYVLPKKLDEKVALLHLKKVGAKLTELNEKQADYIGVSKAGPFKDDTYRY